MASVNTSSILPQLCNRLRNTSCCYNEYLNQSIETCAECPPGTYGWNCKSSCKMGYYGRLCQLPCECSASQCNHVTGCNRDATILPNGSLTQISNNNWTIAQDVYVLTEQKLSHTITANIMDDRLTTQSNPPVLIPTFHELSLVYSLMGSVLSFLILGCILYIRSRRRKSRLSFNVMKHLSNSCVDSVCWRHQHQEDVELSTVHQRPPCEIEDEDMYAEIRLSHLVDGCGASGICTKTMPSLAPKMGSGQVGHSPRESNTYQHCNMGNEYNHVHLNIQRSVRFVNNYGLADDNSEEYVVLQEHKAPNKTDAGCQNLTLPRYTGKEFKRVDSRERNSERPLSDGNLQISQANEPHNAKQSSTEMARENGFLLDRPNSLVHGLSEKDGLGEIGVQVGSRNDDESGENEISVQSGARPYSFAKLL